MRTTSPSPRAAPVAGDSGADADRIKASQKSQGQIERGRPYVWQRKNPGRSLQLANANAHTDGRTTEPHHLSPSWKSRARARPMASPSARATLCAHPRKSTRVCAAAGRRQRPPPMASGMGMGIIRGRVPAPRPGAPPHRSIIHLIPGRFNARSGLGSWNCWQWQGALPGRARACALPVLEQQEAGCSRSCFFRT